MRWLMNIVMLSCKRSAELVEKQLHFKLSSMENVQLKMHHSMCQSCKRFKLENDFIDHAIQKRSHTAAKNSELEQKIVLSDSAKSRIIESISKKL